MARQVFAVGHIRPKRLVDLARVCAWCSRFLTDRDRIRAMNGAPITHCMCESCKGGPGRAA